MTLCVPELERTNFRVLFRSVSGIFCVLSQRNLGTISTRCDTERVTCTSLQKLEAHLVGLLLCVTRALKVCPVLGCFENTLP